MKHILMIACCLLSAVTAFGESADPRYGSHIGTLVHKVPLSGPNRAAKYYLAWKDSIRVLKTQKKDNILSPNIVFAYKNLIVALSGAHWDRVATAKVEDFYNKFHENLYFLAAVAIDDRPLYGVIEQDHFFRRGDNPNTIWVFSATEHDRARILGLLLAAGVEEKFKAASPALQAYYYRNILKHLVVQGMYVPNWKTDTLVPPVIRKVELGEKLTRRHSAEYGNFPTDAVLLEQAWASLCKLSETYGKDEEVRTAWKEAEIFYRTAKKIPERPLPSATSSEDNLENVINPDSSLNCGYAPWLPNAIRTAEKLSEQRKRGKKNNVSGYQYLRAYLEEKAAAVKRDKGVWDEDDAQIQHILRVAYPEQPDRIGRSIKQTDPAKKPPFTVKTEDGICRIHISADHFYRRITLKLPAEVILPDEGYDVTENGVLYHCVRNNGEVRLIFCYLPAGEYNIAFHSRTNNK